MARFRPLPRPLLRLLTVIVLSALLTGSLVSEPLGVGATSPQSNAQTVHRGGTLTIITELGALWSCNMSPFVPPINATPDSWGLIYEPLVFINGFAKKGMRIYTPWLASSFKWSNGGKTLSFTIRKGVHWSDGKPFTAADVVFTFNLIHRYPSLDLAGAWTSLTSVKEAGPYKVVMSLKPGGVPTFFNIADQTYIVAQHIWAHVGDPTKYIDSNPVGTGPLVMQQCTPQNITYARNPHYWQKGKPYIAKVQFPAFTSNPPANLALANDPGDWGGQFVPDIKSYYLAKDPKYRHYWFPPASNNNLTPNLTDPLLSNRAVRQAMSYAINRQQVDKQGEYGYEPPSSQTGLLLPAFQRWYDKALAAKYDFYRYNPAKAITILKNAGFTRGSNGIFEKGGKPLSFSVIVIAGNTDSVADCQVIRTNLRKVGIQITVDPLSGDDFGSRLSNGNFQLAWAGVGGGPSPYYELRNLMDSANTAPIGQPAPTNFERYRSATADQLFNAYAKATTSTKQKRILYQLQSLMLRDVPVIPTVQGVFWYQWSTRVFVGWPTTKDPYANGCPYCSPDWEVVLLHLHLRK